MCQLGPIQKHTNTSSQEDGGKQKECKNVSELDEANILIFDEAHVLAGYRSKGKTLCAINLSPIFSIINFPRPTNMQKKYLSLISNLVLWLSKINNGGLTKELVDVFPRIVTTLKIQNKKLGFSHIDYYYLCLEEICAKLDSLWQNYQEDSDARTVYIEKESIELCENTENILENTLAKKYPNSDVRIFISGTLLEDDEYLEKSRFIKDTGLKNGPLLRTATSFNSNPVNVYIPLPGQIPPPTQKDSFEQAFFYTVRNYAIEHTKHKFGGVLILCSSLSRMNSLYENLKDYVPDDVKLLVQGNMSKKMLVKTFMSSNSPILIGSGVFREGFDAPGKKLTLLILDKLPFRYFNDTKTITKIKNLIDWGIYKNSFDYMLSDMKVTLAQSIGRLIRTENDYGNIIICDNRIREYWNEWNLSSIYKNPKLQDNSDLKITPNSPLELSKELKLKTKLNKETTSNKELRLNKNIIIKPLPDTKTYLTDFLALANQPKIK